MKRLYYLAAFCTALLTVAACQQELANEEENAAPNGPMTLTALTDIIDTKTTMEYKYDIKWQKGDQITVWDEEYYSGTYDTFTLVGDGGTTSGSFRQDGDENVGGNIIAYYPANIAGQYSDDIWWPEVQHQDQQMLMYAQKYIEAGNDETLQFKSMGAIMQLVVTSKTPGVVLKSIKIQDTEKALSGRGVFDDGEISFGNSNKPVVLDLGTGVALGETAKFFNICIPPGTYNNLTFTFTSVDGAVCTKTRNTPLVVERNVVGRLTTACEFTHEAVQLWEDGPFWATTNIGAASPEEYGWYFTYANVEGYSWDGTYWKNALTGATLEGGFTSDNYDTTPGKAFGKNPLDQDHDAAHVIMGGDWRIPTAADFEALMENTTITKTSRTYNGTAVRGMLVTGKGEYSDRSIFFPAAGNGAASLQRTNDLGNYGTSAPATIWSYVFSTGVYSVRYNGFGDFGGRSIRPVFSPNVPVTGISLDRTAMELKQGHSDKLTATVAPAGTSAEIIWHSSNSSVATVEQDGTVAGIAPGTATIIATTAGGAVNAYCEVAVIPWVDVASVSLNQTSLTMGTNRSVSLVPTVLPANATDKSVTWTSSNPSIASVDNTGKVTTGNTFGSTRITATTVDGGKTAYCDVTVARISVTGVSLDKTSVTAPVEGWVELKATVYPEDAYNKNLIWSSSSQSIFVDQEGKVYCGNPGTYTVSVKTEDGEYQANCTITAEFNETGVQLWAGGPYWSTRNLGAVDELDYGQYVCWGADRGYVHGGNSHIWFDPYNNSTYSFTSSNYESYKSSTYCYDNGYIKYIDADLSVGESDDIVRTRWCIGFTGQTKYWRIPDKADFEALYTNTTQTWTTSYKGSGISGMIFSGKGSYQSREIFFPAAGIGNGNNCDNKGLYGFYSVRDYYSSTDVETFRIDKDNLGSSPNWFGATWRYYGYSIRPIRN